MPRSTPRTILAIGFAATALVLASCSADKTSDTTATAETTVAAADTTPVSVDTTVAVDTTAAAADTSEAEPAAETTTAALGDTASVDSAPADPAASGSISEMLIGQMVMGMTGETVADPADVKCISEKVPEKDITAIMSSATAADGSQNTDAMKSLIKAVFRCKPKGLADNFVKSTFNDIPGDVTEAQKKCLTNSLFDLISNDDSVIDAISANTDKMPPSLKTKFTETVKDCVPAGASRDALIKDIDK